MEQNSADNSADNDISSDSDLEPGGGGYASGTTALPPAIANDPFFARLLRNAELRDAAEKASSAKRAKRRSANRRRAKDTADDMYDLDDPFIDDSELTFMDGHQHAKQQKRSKRKKNESEAEGNVAEGMVVDDANDVTRQIDEVDKYDEEDFFVYFGPLNEADEDEQGPETEAATAATAAGAAKRQRKRPEKKATNGATKRKSAGGSKSDMDTGTSKKRQGAAAHADQKLLNSYTNGSTSDAGAQLIPSNGRKGGPRTSRKLDHKPGPTEPGHPATADSLKSRRPPVPARDRPKPTNTADDSPSAANLVNLLTDDSASVADSDKPNKSAGRIAGAQTTMAGATNVSSVVVGTDKAEEKAHMPTPEIESALVELAAATQSEAFSNRQRFPSSLKPPLRQVCELSMAQALEHDREILSLDTSENRVFAWATPLDVVGFTTGIYHRLSNTLPYNRATVRKIVSKLLGRDLLVWKERQLKQLEDGLKARIDEQIDKGLGWIPVGARAPKDSAEDSGAQVRWHWTTLSKHILYQYMILTLNINELRNTLDNGGKDGGGGYREQQARKDAYAHLVSLWPGTSMSTYEISRAYSSRKSLLEKQHRKNEPLLPAASSKLEPVGVLVAPSNSDQGQSGSPAISSAPVAEHSPEPAYSNTASAAAEPQSAYNGQHSSISPVVQRQMLQPAEYLSPQLPPTSMYVDASVPMSTSGSMDAGMMHGSPYQHPHEVVQDRFSSPIIPSMSQQQQHMQMHSPHIQASGLIPTTHILTQQTTTSLDEQVHSRISPYFQNQPSPPQPAHHQQQHRQQQQPYVVIDDSDSQNDSVRNSMSLRNLMSP
ncbi:hypothetical protein FBU59_000334 [Linderina macrospora]|uniref:Uncharacterized protein n=1 Tax=Linderina macrospora TaxID=4868 RepID=A0ACC1JHD0_9FUNG|nr:hypothetical protein FBU59_000334 [Linderina macrospora]